MRAEAEPERPLESEAAPDQMSRLRTFMSDQQVDQGKRTWLIATSCAGAVGGVSVAVPFVSTFAPSERAKAAGAPVEADISALKPGEKMTVEWRGKPVWIVRRTPEQIAELPTTGRVASSAHATVPPSTWPAVSTRTSLRRTTWKCRLICTCPTPSC